MLGNARPRISLLPQAWSSLPSPSILLFTTHAGTSSPRTALILQKKRKFAECHKITMRYLKWFASSDCQSSGAKKRPTVPGRALRRLPDATRASVYSRIQQADSRSYEVLRSSDCMSILYYVTRYHLSTERVLSVSD
jgi:hypothetical protein